ncbi:Bax inhibitor-1/YccA family protein [Prosthecomicrobium sp. N25]|uniref:Bax inhibitor-1/YccA family protein n=1 Tax=Prosthecomicrobium sp. N25 TaxID=3129254 RepID=UPI00307891A6
MSNYGNQYARFGSTVARADAQAVDQGLRAYMISIYNYMAIGVALTGLAALVVYNMSVTTVGAPDAVATIRGGIALTELGRLLFVSPLKWVIVFAPVALVFLLGFRVQSMQPSTAQMVFWLYAALVGVSLATVFLVYTHASIARVFFITAASFGALSLYGYTTSKSLSGWGSFLFMGLIGILIASLVNIFLASSALQFAISVIGVLVFAGLTAYDTQRLKEEYVYSLQGADEATIGRSAIMGALTLYLDFINLFTMLLQLFGQRQE